MSSVRDRRRAFNYDVLPEEDEILVASSASSESSEVSASEQAPEENKIHSRPSRVRKFKNVVNSTAAKIAKKLRRSNRSKKNEADIIKPPSIEIAMSNLLHGVIERQREESKMKVETKPKTDDVVTRFLEDLDQRRQEEAIARKREERRKEIEAYRRKCEDRRALYSGSPQSIWNLKVPRLMRQHEEWIAAGVDVKTRLGLQSIGGSYKFELGCPLPNVLGTRHSMF